jgi:type III restriction enzyme
MNNIVNTIAGRLSLRPPQRRSLEILDRLATIAPPRERTDPAHLLDILRSEFSSLSDFERDFPSFCFALATGVGKTRLMGAFISYLHLAHGIDNFFVLAPNLTIYNKLIADFTPNTTKYVFKGIAEFANDPPEIITGDTYEQRARTLFDVLIRCKINIFNIAKINSEVRGGKLPRIRRLSEYIGESYFDYLASLPDLVLLMDESHRYRASAGIRAINELKPLLGLELTATPYIETSKGAVAFKNVVYDYPLSQAMADGFVKEPAVVTRKDFNPAGMSSEEIERLKLEDGMRLHESVKVELETYARNSGQPIVKPFLLVIARDTTHASQLVEIVESEQFFEGRYAGKVIQVDSSKSGAEEEEMINRLLRVEQTAEPTEIVIHVNMLKEGWDVTNLYTIVPLRAANARILIEQSIGRGLRLPYGKRTGVSAVDRLNIVAHDRFQDIIEEASQPTSAIRLQALVLDESQLSQRTATVVSTPNLLAKLGLKEGTTPAQGESVTNGVVAPVFSSPAEQQIAAIVYQEIGKLANQPHKLPAVEHLARPDIQAELVAAVQAHQPVIDQPFAGLGEQPNIEAIVARTISTVTEQTISIPRILVVPTEDVRSGFHPFTLDLSALRYPPVSDELWVQHLRTGRREILALGKGGVEELRLEDYIVSGLVDFDDIAYDEHADLLYDLATQTVEHFLSYLSRDEAKKVLRTYQRPIAQFIRAQMQQHAWSTASGYEVKVSKGFSELKPSAYTHTINELPLPYHVAPNDLSNMPKYLFGGFARCLYSVQKFDSNAERRLAVILEREAEKWFRPARGQFHIYYQQGGDQFEYQPDFVAETSAAIYMLEPKASSELNDAVVQAKKDAAVLWCKQASDYAASYGGKPWHYLLIPHTAIADNMTLAGLAEQYRVTS